MSFHFRPNQDFTRIIELTPVMREQIENTIEHLLSVLDYFDGDESLEDVDPVEDCGDDEDGADREPTLGALERHPSSWEYLHAGVLIRERGDVWRSPQGSQAFWGVGGFPAITNAKRKTSTGETFSTSAMTGRTMTSPVLVGRRK